MWQYFLIQSKKTTYAVPKFKIEVQFSGRSEAKTNT